MTWLFEDPWMIVLGGLVAEIILGVLLLKTGRGAVLGGMIGVLVLTGVLLVVERLVVTEGEQVQATLEDAAAAVVKNDPAAVQKFIAPADAAPSAAGLRIYAAMILGRYTIEEAHIGGDLDIQLDTAAKPPTATARFTAQVRFKDHKGMTPYDHYVGKVRVDLRKAGDHWEVLDFNDEQRGHPGAKAGN
jgi:hypothetical protein